MWSFVAEIAIRTEFLFPRTRSSHGLDDGCAEGGEAVQDGEPDVELGDLPVEVPRREALTEQLDAMHLRLGAASAVVAAPSSPNRAGQAA